MYFFLIPWSAGCIILPALQVVSPLSVSPYGEFQIIANKLGATKTTAEEKRIAEESHL